jgi:hypothetical protein
MGRMPIGLMAKMAMLRYPIFFFSRSEIHILMID